jgi:hypothetical protein
MQANLASSNRCDMSASTVPNDRRSVRLGLPNALWHSTQTLQTLGLLIPNRWLRVDGYVPSTFLLVQQIHFDYREIRSNMVADLECLRSLRLDYFEIRMCRKLIVPSVRDNSVAIKLDNVGQLDDQKKLTKKDNSTFLVEAA